MCILGRPRPGPVLVRAACGGVGPSDRPHVLLPGGGLALSGEREERHSGEGGPSLM